MSDLFSLIFVALSIKEPLLNLSFRPKGEILGEIFLTFKQIKIPLNIRDDKY